MEIKKRKLEVKKEDVVFDKEVLKKRKTYNGLGVISDIISSKPQYIPGTSNIKRLKKLLVSEIVVKDQIRKNIDRKSLEELARSIEVEGLIHPIVVSDNGDGTYTLEAGHRRFLAIRDVLRKDEIEAIVLPSPPGEKRPLLQLYENILREDLKPLEMAEVVGELFLSFFFRTSLSQMSNDSIIKYLRRKSFLRKIDELEKEERLKVEEFSRQTCLSINKISVLLYLWSQPEKVKTVLSKLSNVTLTHYRELMIRGVDGEDLLKIATEVDSKGMSVREMVKYLSRDKRQKNLKEERISTREERFLKSVYNFATKIKRSKVIKKNPELREKLREILKALLSELEG